MEINKKTYRHRLIENIDAIGIAHTQMMDILKEDIDLEKMSEDKWKAIADGKGKAQEVADKLLNQLKDKEAELFKIDNPDAEKTNKDLENENKKAGSSMNQHIN